MRLANIVKCTTALSMAALFGCAAAHRTIEGIPVHGESLYGLTVTNVVLATRGHTAYVEGSVVGKILRNEDVPAGILVKVTSNDGTGTTEIKGCYQEKMIRTGPLLRLTVSIRSFRIALPSEYTSVLSLNVSPRVPALDCVGSKKYLGTTMTGTVLSPPPRN